MKPMLSAALLPALLAACGTGAAVTADPATTPATTARADSAAALERVIAGNWRTPEFAARDSARHPKETLAFFGIRPDMTVVEIAPGGGWYMELLAPYLRDQGRYVGAIVDPATVAPERREAAERARRALAERQPATVFDRATIHGYDPKAPRFGPDASADAVLTFRNVHNWLSAGNAQAMFEGFHRVLKDGGVLGVVEHRAGRELPADDRSGYVAEQTVIALAEAAGFRLDARSDINANPADTRDHPNGVWTLPPTNRHEDADAAKYRTIGESDRMTLRFIKD